METTHLIQASANVIKITNLKIGDVFKQVEDTYSAKEMYYGVVLDLLNSGTKTFIQVLRYKKSYDSVSAEIQTFAGDKDVAIFPTRIEEVQEYLKSAMVNMKEKLEDKKKELAKMIEGINKAEEFVSGELSKSLTCMSYKELPQTEYNSERLRIAEQKKALDAGAEL